MAAPQVISFGLGTPASVPNFLTFGLSGANDGPSGVVDLTCASTESLVTARRTSALGTARTVEALGPVRRTQVVCS